VSLERETLHVMDDKQRIALVETRTQGDDHSPGQLIRYQFGNHLGSASLELDDAGQIISYEEYYAYGSTSYQAVRSQTEPPKRLRYTGMERDEESGLEYHSARYYLPWLGRWLSGDPIGIKGGWHLYVYCRSNPIALIDLDGRAPWSLWNRVWAKAQELAIRIVGALAEGGPEQMSSRDEIHQQMTKLTEKPTQKPSGAGDPAPPSAPSDKRLVTANDLHANRNLGNAQAVPDKRLVTANDLHVNRNLGNAQAVPDKRLVTANDLHANRNLGNAQPVQPLEPGKGGGEGGGGGEGRGGGGSTAGNLVTAVVIAGLQSNNVREFVGNSAFNMAVAECPPLAAVTAKDEGSALAAIVAAYVAPVVVRLGVRAIVAAPPVAILAGSYLVGNATRATKMSAPGVGADQSWATPGVLGGTKSGCENCHEAVRVDNYYKTHPEALLMLNEPASRGGIPTNKAMGNYLKNGSF
jgi:RHS repeat-associated protein